MSVPRLFGNYVLLHRLAKGSTSEIYLAQTMGEFSRLCAVKLLRHDLAQLPEFGNRFREDAALLVRLIHGNLVQVLEVGSVEDQYFIAMELLEGIDLPELLDQTQGQDPLPPEFALFVGLEMTEALNYIHSRRREAWGSSSFPSDMPWPLEVMISFDGVVKVGDLGSFGAVRLGAQKVSRLFRSPGYAVPEVILKKPLDMRTDVFAVGMVVWELLMGRPLAASNAKQYVGQVLAGHWKAPLIKRRDVPGDVIRAVMQMLSLDPNDRPARLEEVREPLVGGLRRLSPTFGSASVSELLWRRCKEHISRIEALTSEVLQRGLSAVPSEERPSTLSFGRSGEADRDVKDPIELKQGERIPGTRYKMVRELGGGGNAEVFAAQHVELDRQVAIKIISPRLARSSRNIDFFRAEARACSRVGHPNIVDVIDFGELEDKRFYFAMELLDGHRLDKAIQTAGALSSEQTIGVARQITRALQAVHEVGIVHRDLKPDNIMLIPKEERDDFVKILDFGGTAFAGQSEDDRVGTIGYMAPELVRGETATPAMDIYSVGVILYQMLSGELPYKSNSFEEFAEIQSKGPPAALRTLDRASSVPAALERVVHRALERDPGARHPSMADLEAELIKAQKEAGLVTAWDSLPHPSAIQDRRVHRAKPHRVRGPVTPSGYWVAAGAIVGALVVIVLIILFSRPGPQEVVQPPTISPPMAAISPPAPPPDAGPAGLSAGLQKLLAKAEDAADRGQFTRPEGKSALDILLKIEQVAPDDPSTARLRKRLARMLEGAADRLMQGKLVKSARTLYREALLFSPDSEKLHRLAYPDRKPSQTRNKAVSRPEASEAMVSWLVSMVQMSVMEGRYLSPPRNNALHFLNELKRVDPKGNRTAEARKSLAKSLHKQAGALWDAGELADAKRLYRTILQMNPADRLARERVAAKPKPKPVAKDAGAKAPTPQEISEEDRARAEALCKEGKGLLYRGQLGQAKSKYDAALKANPRSSAALTGLATVAFEQSSYTSAVALARKAIARNRGNTAAYLVLGDANFNLYRYADARKAWERVLKLSPSNTRAKSGIKRLDEQTK